MRCARRAARLRASIATARLSARWRLMTRRAARGWVAPGERVAPAHRALCPRRCRAEPVTWRCALPHGQAAAGIAGLPGPSAPDLQPQGLDSGQLPPGRRTISGVDIQAEAVVRRRIRSGKTCAVDQTERRDAQGPHVHSGCGIRVWGQNTWSKARIAMNGIGASSPLST